MCGPAALPIMMGAGLVLGAAGTYMQYKAQREQADAENKANEFNARMQEKQAANYEAQARDVEKNVTKEESKLRSNVRGIRGAQRSAYAGAGVVADTGSAADVAADTELAGDFDAMTLRSNAAKEAWALRTQNQAALDQARLARMGRRTNTAANATLLSGASNLGMSYYSAFGKK